MRKDIKRDPELYAEFTKLFDQGGNRATQWALMERYVQEYPSRDLKLFPNLAYLVPDSVDLDDLPSRAEIDVHLRDAGDTRKAKDGLDTGGPEDGGPGPDGLIVEERSADRGLLLAQKAREQARRRYDREAARSTVQGGLDLRAELGRPGLPDIKSKSAPEDTGPDY